MSLLRWVLADVWNSEDLGARGSRLVVVDAWRLMAMGRSARSWKIPREQGRRSGQGSRLAKRCWIREVGDGDVLRSRRRWGDEGIEGLE